LTKPVPKRIECFVYGDLLSILYGSVEVSAFMRNIPFIFQDVLYHTTGNPDFFLWWNILHFSGDFIFGFLADGASIKDDNISFFFGF
jgi:hypothetical protein